MTKNYFLIIFLFISFQSSSQCDPSSIFANESTNAVCFEEMNTVRKCYTNNIPDHDFGPFGGMNTMEAQDFDYSMCLFPNLGTTVTPLNEDPISAGCGNGIIFGVSTQGINYSPFARLYFVNPNTMEENTDFHIEADFTLNMDLNGGHVNAASRYHYHNIPTDYFTNDLNIDGSQHSPILGYAADGFPIYYKFLYADGTNPNSLITTFESSYNLKSGDRPGDGITAPNGSYDGTYVEDYEFINSPTSILDECGGRFGVTPEYPNGTYYYVLTDNWPYIPRCLKGEFVDNSFRLGQNCPSSTALDDCAEGTTSIDQVDQIELKIFPNPTNEYVNIDLGNNFNPTSIHTIKIYSLDASVVYQSSEYKETVNLIHLNPGTYFIQIDFDHNQITKKLIVQ